jgi:S-adenosylmethionine hydrolase
MSIHLFTDFGFAGPYIGQVSSVLSDKAPGIPVINLLCDAPFANPRASAYLLSALSDYLPFQTVVIAVVDPGVGGQRKCLCMRADSCWYLGPDNGLLAILAKRYPQSEVWEIDVDSFIAVSNSFHGRDIFAPVAAAIAIGKMPDMKAMPMSSMTGFSWEAQLPEVIYIDGYGNAMTGIREIRDQSLASALEIEGRVLLRSSTFCDVNEGGALFYRNSIGLLEISVNQGNAAHVLNLEIGQPVNIHC